MAKEKDVAKDIVKDVFEKSKTAAARISTIFTHFTSYPKISKKRIKLPRHLKELPAAVDMGTSSIKLLQLAESLKGELEIIALDKEEYSLPLSDSPILNQKQALKKLLERNQISQRVITCLSAKEIRVYNLNFPAMSETELVEALHWKIAQLKPFGLGIEKIKYGFIKYDSLFAAGPSSNQHKLLVVCAPSETIEKKISFFQEMELRLVGIEVAALSLVNLTALKGSNLKKEGVLMWIDLGGQESSLIISRAGFIYFLRNLSLTSKQITQQIARNLQIDDKEAEKAKQQWGLSQWSADKKAAEIFPPLVESLPKAQDKSAAIFQIMASSLENMVVDIEHSFKYFSYQVTQSQITKFDRIILSGGGANLKNLERFLSTRLAASVEKIDIFPWLKISDSLREQKKGLISLPAEFAVCAGLAGSQRVEPAKHINLLPQATKGGIEKIVTQLQEKPLQLASLILVLVLLLVGLQIARLGMHKVRMKENIKEVREVQAQLASLQSQQLKLADQEGELFEERLKLQNRFNFLKGAMRRPEEFSRVLAQVADFLPEKVWVTSLLYLESERKLNISGSTSDMHLIMQLVETLKKSEDFVDANFSYTQIEAKGSDVYNFEVIAEVRP